MQIENIIKALEHQRNAALTQNVELMARVFELEQKIEELTQKELPDDK
jgi:phage shock protein A